MTKLTNAARDAIPGLVRLLGTIPPGWRAAISFALLGVFALLAWLAVRHDQPDWLPILGTAAAAVLHAALAAAGGTPPDGPSPPAPGGVAGAALLVLLLGLPGCAALQQAAGAADRAADTVRQACQLAVDVEAHCALLDEQTEGDTPAHVAEMCGRAQDAVRLCGRAHGDAE